MILIQNRDVVKFSLAFIFPFLSLAVQSSGDNGFLLKNNIFTDTTFLHLYGCPGEVTVSFEGEMLSAGEVKVFKFNSQNGSDSLVKVIVNTAPLVDFWAEAEPACPNNANGQIHFYDHVGPTAPYEFSIDGGATFHDEYTYINLPAGQYQLRARDAAGCVYEYKLEIPNVPRLQVQLPDRVISCADSALLKFSIAPHPVPFSWHWTLFQTGETFTDSLLWVKTSGHYNLSVDNQCEAFNGTVLVEFEKELTPQIYLPNSFSPNGDGINDCFRAYAATGLQLLEFQLQVFDRWGEKVFETHELKGCWDGTFLGKATGAESYAWFVIATIRDCDGIEVRIFREGSVIIVKW